MWRWKRKSYPLHGSFSNSDYRQNTYKNADSDSANLGVYTSRWCWWSPQNVAGPHLLSRTGEAFWVCSGYFGPIWRRGQLNGKSTFKVLRSTCTWNCVTKGRLPAGSVCHGKLQTHSCFPLRNICHLLDPCGLGSAPSSSTLLTGSHCLLMGEFGALCSQCPSHLSPRFPGSCPAHSSECFSCSRFFPFSGNSIICSLHILPVCSILSPSVFPTAISVTFLFWSLYLNFSFLFSISKHLRPVLGKFLSYLITQS